MIQWYRDGNFPLEKLIKTFPVRHALCSGTIMQ